MNKVTVHNIKLYYITFPFLTSAKKRKGKRRTKNYIKLSLHYTYTYITYYALLHIVCGYQCDKAMTKNDTREVI